MFTGLIQDVGEVKAFVPHGKGASLTIQCALDLETVEIGESIAVNGACLTVVEMSGSSFKADLSPETLSRTALSGIKTGTLVNLERALRLGDRLGGHLVQGHVDGVGTLEAVNEVGESWEITWRLPIELMQTVIEKGSIALDGVSLTVAKLEGQRVTAAVVPHTAEMTAITRTPLGSAVNVETDMIGKYVQRLVKGQDGEHGLSLDVLKKAGYA
jgi:riboflavin synthase